MGIYASEDLIKGIIHILLIYDMLCCSFHLVSFAIPEVDHMNENRLRTQSYDEIVGLYVSVDVAQIVNDF